jgi:hypothetical protein
MELSSRRLYDLWSWLDDLLETGVPGAEEERGDNECPEPAKSGSSTQTVEKRTGT